MKASGLRNGSCRLLPVLLSVVLLSSIPCLAAVLQVPAQYGTIQEAIDAAASGDIIQIAAGNYVEQLDIGSDITISGAGRENTIITAPAVLAVKFAHGAQSYRPVVYVHGSSATTLRELTVDGQGQGNANSGFIGIAFDDAGGAVANAGVRSICETPMTATADGVGLYGRVDEADMRALNLDNVAVKDCQQLGMELAGGGLSATISGCMLFGPGDAGGAVPPSGILITAGAEAEITGNEVSGFMSCGAGCGPDPRTELQAAGIRLNGAGAATRIEDNLLIENDVAIWAHGDCRVVENFLLDNRYAGLVLRGGSHNVGGTNFQGDHRVGIWVLAESYGDNAELYNLCLNGPGGSEDAGIAGVFAWSDGPALDVWAHNCTVSQWSVGLRAEGTATRLAVNESSIHTNWIAGYDNTACGAAQNAEYNWWNAADGPAPVGSGELVLGSGVDTEPNLTEDYDVDVTCGLQRRGTVVGPVAPSECLSLGHTCVEDISFDITRSETAQMRGFSITFTLSNEITLCNGLASITEGSYLLDSGGSTWFEKHDNGGGSYSVDCVLLGEPCGADAPAGTLFYIDVKKATGQPDGVGTISMSSLTLRDCDNQPIAADMGGDATLTVDTEAPVAVADLVATQDKAGNGTDGLTFINLSFTAPGDAADIIVYRAPFGQYPEYDDNGGAAPALPSYPPGSPWELTSVNASGQSDEPATRDFWYYVVFTKDACENVSAVSNMTAGTLDYHLGDVAPYPTGDNDVATLDVSRLSSTYWKASVDPDYLNDCDVGPTTDYSVDALPMTDNEIGFEDLMIFGMNFAVVSANGHDSPIAAPSGDNRPTLTLICDAARPGGTITARLTLEGNVDVVKGIHAIVAFEPDKLALQGVTWSDFMSEQGAPVFRSHHGGEGVLILDAALLGRDLTFEGSGELATLSFTRIGGNALPELALADLRDAGNRVPNVAPEVVTAAPAPAVRPLLETAFLGARPNPFLGQTDLVFTLATESRVSLRIFDAGGRLVRTLCDALMPAGEQHMTWDGLASNGSRVSAGVYMCTFKAGDMRATAKMFHYR